MIPSMGKVYNLGHRALAELLDGPVVVQEKIDGSQISWMWDENGVLHARSKGALLHSEEGNLAEGGMFAPVITHLLDRGLIPLPGYVLRGETLSQPKHNTLAYSRVPQGYVMLFAVEYQNGFGDPSMLQDMATLMDVEYVQEFEFTRIS